jgi:hypothetical protein
VLFAEPIAGGPVRVTLAKGPFSSFLTLTKRAHLGSYTSFGCARAEAVRIW